MHANSNYCSVMIIAPLWRGPQVQSKCIPTLRKQRGRKKNNNKTNSKFELAGHEWDVFLSEILKLKIIVVTRKKMPKGQDGNVELCSELHKKS